MPTTSPSISTTSQKTVGWGPKQDLVELVLGGLDGVGLPLVLGQLADQPEHGRDVRWGGGPDHDRRP